MLVSPINCINQETIGSIMAFHFSFASFFSPFSLLIIPIFTFWLFSKICLVMVTILGLNKLGVIWLYLLFVPLYVILGAISCSTFNFIKNLGTKLEKLVNEFYVEFACDCGLTWRVESYNHNIESKCPRCKCKGKTTSRTSYHGNYRVFGRFLCQPCKREWASHVSWANVSQNCISCQSGVYPFKQVSLIFTGCLFLLTFWFLGNNFRHP